MVQAGPGSFRDIFFLYKKKLNIQSRKTLVTHLVLFLLNHWITEPTRADRQAGAKKLKQQTLMQRLMSCECVNLSDELILVLHICESASYTHSRFKKCETTSENTHITNYNISSKWKMSMTKKTRLKRGYNIFRFYKNAHITKKSTETRFTKFKSFSQLNNSQIWVIFRGSLGNCSPSSSPCCC